MRTVYCAQCQEELTEIPAKLPTNAVTLDLARYLEALFQRFVYDGVQRLDRWPEPEGAPLRKLARGPAGVVGGLPDGFLATHPLGEALKRRLSHLPSNHCMRIEAIYKSWLPWRRRKRSLQLVVACYAPLQSLLERGYIVERASANELNAILDSMESSDGSSRILLAFSPTEWDDSLAIPDGVVLVGASSDGSWQIRDAIRQDHLRTYVQALFDVHPDEDNIARCTKIVESLPPERFPLSARQTAQQNDLSLYLVAQAFRAMADQRSGYVLCVDTPREDWLLDLK